MKSSLFFKLLLMRSLVIALCVGLAFSPFFTIAPALAAPGGVLQTPVTPMELPIEVEIELSPAGSLKQAPLWKELYQLLANPYAPVVRRPGFGAVMPPLNVYPLDYNFLTGQPLRLRTSDGEISWDQPGPMFDPAEPVALDAFNSPTQLRTVIGHLVACPDIPPYQAAAVPANFCDGKPVGSLVVHKTSVSALIPPDGTVVAVSAVVGGVLQQLDGTSTTATVDVVDLEIPVNEHDFFRPATDTAGVPAALQPYIGRPGAEVLGKALFWDMQIGSDGVQACGSCHFHAGVDNRTKNQLNPNHLGGDLTLQVMGSNQAVAASHFPFHKLADPNLPGEPLLNPGNVISDANDVMSSMGVIFRQFVDVIVDAVNAFIPGTNPPALKPDVGSVAADPIPVYQDLRRVEPRNTPTFHSAAFNLDNFWDGRARFHFNGGSVFGPSDPQFHIFIDNGGVIEGASNGHLRPALLVEDPELAEQPLRIKFSSLASQAAGPPLSNFEMSFDGRNWQKIGKKMLQAGVTPLANQMVSPSDSVLGPFSGQRSTVGGPIDLPGRAGLNVSYVDLIELAFRSDLWSNTTQSLIGTAALCTSAVNGVLTPPGCDPFDGYVLGIANTPAIAANTNQFTQMEANFSLFFGLAVQAYESLTIPDDTPFDRFMDANPLAGHGVGEPGDQAVLFPTLIPGLVGPLTLIPDDPSTPEYDGFGPDELFGFDIFAGGNLTAALSPAQAVDPRSGVNRNPLGFGSNPFTRSAKCMLCHLGPEQTDHSINIAHGLLKNNAESEFPTPPVLPDPGAPDNCVFADCLLPAPEPSGASKAVGGLILAEEVAETPQDAVEVEPRNFATVDDPATPWDDRVVAQPGNFAFGDQGIYNIGLRPVSEDIGRGGNDPFGWPLSLAALSLKNIGGPVFEPNDGPGENNVMANFDPFNLGATFEDTGGGFDYPGAPGYTLQSINPGFERSPLIPLMPAYMAPWINGLPAGELHPQIDEMAGFAPNTLTPPNGGPGIEFPEIMFGADLHCGVYNPAVFGNGPPNFGWGATDPVTGDPVAGRCPNNQSGVAGNFDFPVQGTWPVSNRVLRDGAFKAPHLRNVELTGPYFHTGSYLTLRQVVDFYMRGGDFPITNAENRDPHIVELEEQAFAFGRTTGADLAAPVNHIFSVNPPFTLVGTFADGLPDTAFLYDVMPDTNHPITPESTTSTPEQAKVALVKFLLSFTDPRVKYERAPFDRPEIFVPIDGTALDNTGGRAALLADPRFRHVPAVGGAGRPYPLPNFLGVLSTQGLSAPPGTESLITSYYNNALDRAPDPAGLASWVAVAAQVTRRPSHFDSVISIATTFGISINEVFISIGKVIFNSPEYLSLNKTDNAYVVDLYQTFLGREPDPAGLANWVGLLTGGVSRNLVLNFFVFSAEFNSTMEGIFGAIPSRPENDLVNDFYRGLLSRLPDAAGFENWVTQMRTAQCTGGAAEITALSTQIAQLFIGSPEYGALGRTDAEFIEDLYDAILRRGSDPAGFNFWVNYLSTSTRAQVLQLFTASPEFQLRVQTVINAGCLQ